MKHRRLAGHLYQEALALQVAIQAIFSPGLRAGLTCLALASQAFLVPSETAKAGGSRQPSANGSRRLAPFLLIALERLLALTVLGETGGSHG